MSERNTIARWQRLVRANEVNKGFADDEPEDLTKDYKTVATKLALIHSEASEALECARNGEWETTLRADGKPEGFPSELADVVIRCMTLAEAMNIDLESEIFLKHNFNLTRPAKHGKAF